MTGGSCLCGDVRFTVEGPLGPVTACHCTQCRKITGHFSASAPAPAGGLTVTGAVAWYRSSEAARRGFCPRCGSYLFWDNGGEVIHVSAGAFDGDPGTRLTGHIHAACKGAYYEIADGLPVADLDADAVPMGDER